MARILLTLQERNRWPSYFNLTITYVHLKFSKYSWNGRDIKMSRKDFWLLLPSVRSTLYPNCSGGYVSSDEIFEGRFRAVPILSSTHQADWQLMAPHYGAAAASALTAPPHNIYPWSTFKFLLIIDESKKGWWTDARRYVRHAIWRLSRLVGSHVIP